MVLSSIALIGTTAALCAVLFKSKESRVNEIINFLGGDPGETRLDEKINILRNNHNAYITGVKDVDIHPILLEIMAKYNKPVGYFSKLDGKLYMKSSFFVDIKGESLLKSLSDRKSVFSYLAFIVMLCIVHFLALSFDIDNNNPLISNTASFLMSVFLGMILYMLIENVSYIWANNVTSKEMKEYKDVFTSFNNYKTDCEDRND